nr:hypothetical protein [Endozoicomonas sp.]
IRDRLELARFRAACFEKRLLLKKRDGTQIMNTGADVLDSFPKTQKGKLGEARFMGACFVEGRPLNKKNSNLITGEDVLKAYQEIKAQLESSRFMEKCFVEGLPLKGRDGHPITGKEVLDSFPASREGRLSRARFMGGCFEKGLRLEYRNGKRITITGEDVFGAFEEINARLESAHLMEICFRKGWSLRLKDRDNKPVALTGEGVLEAYQEINAVLDSACFMEICFQEGLSLRLQDKDGKPVKLTGEVVLEAYRAINAEQESAHFMVNCFVKGQPLNGRDGHPITGKYILDNCPASRQGRLVRARFMGECFVRDLPLKDEDGEAITIIVEDVLGAYEEISAKLELIRFKEACCLRGIRLPNKDGQYSQVMAEDIIKAYKQGHWLLEAAIFMSQLALWGIPLDGHHLVDKQIMDAFAGLPGNHTSRQVDYLIRRLNTLPEIDETGSYLTVFQQAWQLLLDHPQPGEQVRCQQWMLRFIAMRQGLTVDGQLCLPDQVLEHLDNLRTSFRKTRLKFYFLVDIYFTGRHLKGLPVNKKSLSTCLEELPKGSRRRVALELWLERQCLSQSQPDVLARLIGSSHRRLRGREPAGGRGDCPSPANPTPRGGHPEIRQSGGRVPGDHAVTDNATYGMKPLLSTSEAAGTVRTGELVINDLIKRALHIIQEVNATGSCPAILVTGSFSRCLQGLCTSFNDIDLIVKQEAVNALNQQLRCQLSSVDIGQDYSLSVQVNTYPMPGCREIALPWCVNTVLGEGDFNQNKTILQASIQSELPADTVSISVPGVEHPVICLSFYAEMQLMVNALTHLTDKLEPLTGEIQRGAWLYIPRAVVFYRQNTAEQRVHALLMRCLLTLDKAEKLVSIPEPGETGGDTQGVALRLSIRRSINSLQEKLRDHSHRDSFRQSLCDWLSQAESAEVHDRKKNEFVRKLYDRMGEIAALGINEDIKGIESKVLTHVQSMINEVNATAQEWAVILVSGSYARGWQMFHRSIDFKEIELTATSGGIKQLRQRLMETIGDNNTIPLSVICASETIHGYDPLYVPDQECIEIRTVGNRHLLTVRANIWQEIPVYKSECRRVHPADRSEAFCDLVSFYGEAVLWLTTADAYLNYTAAHQSGQGQGLDDMPESLVCKWPFALRRPVFALLIQGVSTLMRGEALGGQIQGYFGYTKGELSENSILQSEISDRIEKMKASIGKAVALSNLIHALDCWLLQSLSESGCTGNYDMAKSLKDKMVTLRDGYGQNPVRDVSLVG